MTDAYAKAGVNIDAGDRLVKNVGPFAAATARPGADGKIGGFGGLFDLRAAGFTDPILVAGTDGVGTKLKLAFALDRHNTIGIDLVAMCVNDVLAQGAEPLFFLDYYATGQLDSDAAAEVVRGIADGCKLAGCALIGGETAEMPGMYVSGEYDIAGFCVGAVERSALMPRETRVGDIMVGLASSGPHANGYSLIRKIITDAGFDPADPSPFSEDQSIGEALLTPTRIYVKSVLPLLSSPDIRAFAHITGGGLTENVPRVLSAKMKPRFEYSAISAPPVFEWLQRTGQIPNEDMRRTFNCGVGGVLICAPSAADRIISELASNGERAFVLGEIVGN